MELLTDVGAWVGLATLTALLLVLSLDNAVFISILAGQADGEAQQARARRIGLFLSLGTNIALLGLIGFVKKLETTLVVVRGFELSWRDLVLVLGGLVLIAKATLEIHEKLEGEEEDAVKKAGLALGKVVAQMAGLNLVFSIDSVLTAVGMAERVEVMGAAIVLSSIFLVIVGLPLGAYVAKHPTLKMLALAFLVLIGANLLVEGLHGHIPKGYTYFAMAFSVGVEMLNLRARARRKAKPIELRHPHVHPAE